MSQLRLITTVSIHSPDTSVALAIRHKNYVATIGRHRRMAVIASIDGQLLLTAAIRIRDPKIPVSARKRAINDLVVGHPSKAAFEIPVGIAERDLGGAAGFAIGCNPDI